MSFLSLFFFNGSIIWRKQGNFRTARLK
jgi:hypothetical protein